MKTLFLKSLTYVSVVSMTAQAQAATEVIMTPLSKKGVEWLKTVKRPELISKSQKVFLSGEQKALIELGASLSAQTEVWTISADSKVESITRWIQSSSGGSVGVETRETVFEVKSTDVAALAKNQWALKNVGQSVRIDIDDLSTTEVKGKSGEDIGIDRAGVEKLSDKPVIVAVLDTGVDYTHPDLMDAIAIDLDECKADLEFGKCEKIENKDEKEACKKKYEFLDADNNGYVRDCAGWNTAEGVPDKTTGVRGNNKAFDLNGHGTHVAGIIAATGKEGVRGVSKNIRILPVKVLTASPEAPVRPQSAESLKEGVPQDIPLPDERGKKWGSALVDNVARGVLYALRNNAQVMNISLGWGQKANSPLLRQMIELATKKNVIVVAAAGNDSTDAMISPCDFEGVICAGSHDPDGKMTHFSNFGPGVDIAAPGLNVLSTWPRALRARLFTDRRGYNIANGTSQATPYVVGAAGRLLSQGVPSNEIYPRLMLGARPQEFNFATDKYVLSGNLDIARSEAVQPQVAIFPASRQVVRIPWDRVSMNLDLPIALKNFWQEGEDVSVALSAVDSEFAVIGNQTVSFAKWGEGESKTWKAQVRLANRGVRSDLVLVAEVKVAGRVIRKVPLAFDLYVPVSESLSDNFLIRSTLQDKINVGAGTVRSVTGLGEYESQFEFVQVRPSPEGTSFNFYQFDGKSNIRQIINALVKVPVGELLLIQKGKFFGATPGYTLIYRVRLADPKEPLQIHFLFFDLKMQPKAVPGKSGDNANVMIFDNKRYVINDKFNWMSLKDSSNDSNGKSFVPMWISSGYIPDLEKPKFDPWNPKPVESRESRVYYATAEGVRTVKIEDEEMYPLDIVLPTSEEKLKGQFSLLMAKGDEFENEFFMGTVTNGKLSDLREVDLKEYRQLKGLNQFKLLGADSKLATEGSVFMGASFRASQRVTGFQNSKVVMDNVLQPLKIVDAIINLVGAFKGNDTSGVYSQTIYDLQYHDFKTGQVHTISSRRFSFLPLALFGKTMVPMLVKQGSGDFLPSVYSGAGQGLSVSQDLVVPKMENGRIAKLARPAFLRLESGQGCRELANVIPATKDRAALFPFVCGSEVLFVPAELE